jgi:hypothetical protein
VEWADEACLGAVARCEFAIARQRHAAVAAGVVVGLHARRCAHDDDRLANVVVFDPVAKFGDLLEPASHLPDMRPEVIELCLVELFVEIALDGDALGIIDREGHGAQAAISRFQHGTHLSDSGFSLLNLCTGRAPLRNGFGDGYR